jgi:hypothetical protein
LALYLFVTRSLPLDQSIISTPIGEPGSRKDFKAHYHLFLAPHCTTLCQHFYRWPQSPLQMAAMDVVRSPSLLPRTPSSATQDSLRYSQQNRAPTPEPHYRLSRLNTPPTSATLRPPSIVSRSVSAGMTFSFSKKEKEKEKEKHKDTLVRSPSPDDRAPSRFGFTLRKKVSLASLIGSSYTPTADDIGSSRASSSSSANHNPVLVSPIVEAPSPIEAPQEEAEVVSDDDADAPERFVKKNVWRTRNKMKLHPYPDAPYMQTYDPVVLERCATYFRWQSRELIHPGTQRAPHTPPTTPARPRRLPDFPPIQQRSAYQRP